MNNLLDTQIEAVANFQAITDTWDTEEAVEVLERNNWDVSKASQAYLSNNSSHYSPPANPARPTQPDQRSWNKTIKSFFSSIWKSIIPEEIRGETSKSAQAFSQQISSSCVTPVSLSTLQFQELLSYCHESKKPLLIYLHDYSDDYPINLFSDNRLINFLNNEYVYWGVHRQSPEGKMLKTNLNIELFPFTAILHIKDPRQPIVMWRNSGYSDVRQILTMAENHSYNVNAALLQERRLRESQEEELKEAMRVVMQREKEVKEKEQSERAEKERVSREAERILKELKERVGDEPENANDVAQVSFRLQSGQRVNRRFKKDRAVLVLYDYLKTIGIEAGELITGLPSRSLDDKAKTLEEEGIFPESVIHVRPLKN